VCFACYLGSAGHGLSHAEFLELLLQDELAVRTDRQRQRRLQAALARRVGGRVGLVVSDTHGRAFRRGLVNVAIGVAGFRPLVDHRGGVDRSGRTLVATEQALADELAGAAGMLMGKDAGLPAVLACGVATQPGPGGVGDRGAEGTPAGAAEGWQTRELGSARMVVHAMLLVRFASAKELGCSGGWRRRASCVAAVERML